MDKTAAFEFILLLSGNEKKDWIEGAITVFAEIFFFFFFKRHPLSTTCGKMREHSRTHIFLINTKARWGKKNVERLLQLILLKDLILFPPFLISLCAHVGCIFRQLPWHSSEHPKSKCLRGKRGKTGVDAHYWAVKPSARRIAAPAWAEMMHRVQALVWTLQSAWQELKQLLSNETNIPWQLMM